MSDNVQIIKPTNFIRNQINNDLDSYFLNLLSHASLQSQMATFTLVTQNQYASTLAQPKIMMAGAT